MRPVGTGPIFGAAFRAELRDLMRWRRDVRRFRDTPVDDALIEELLRDASLAPSVGLSEPWRFVIVADAGRRAAVRGNFLACNRAALEAMPASDAELYARLKLAGLDDAPCHLAAFVEPEPAQGRGLGRATMPETIVYSAVMAIHSLWLTARAAGLGVGWVSILDPVAIAVALDVPAGWRLIAYLCLGYPDEAADTPALARAGWEVRGDSMSRVLRR